MAGVGALALLVISTLVALVSARVEDFAHNHGVELSSLEEQIPLERGLVWGFYSKTCPQAENIVSQFVANALRKDSGIPPGLLRIFFHDCFVQGCDASILLRTNQGSELNDPANASIRKSALALIDSIKAQLEAVCPRTVSCADIVVLASRDAVKQTGGPAFNVPLGRLDSFGRHSTNVLPSPFSSFGSLIGAFNQQGLDTKDLVSLATGGHTLGVAQCGSFAARLFPTVDPQYNPNFANFLKTVCKSPSSTATTGLDFNSATKFDNSIFKHVVDGGALLLSDQNLNQNTEAWNLAHTFANNQGAFFSQFQTSFIKMSQLQVITDSRFGEVRKFCSKPNRASSAEMEPSLIELVADQ